MGFLVWTKALFSLKFTLSSNQSMIKRPNIYFSSSKNFPKFLPKNHEESVRSNTLRKISLNDPVSFKKCRVPTDYVALAVYTAFVRFSLLFRVVGVPTILDFETSPNPQKEMDKIFIFRLF
ncbi:hypothetical protein LEP1GSC191_2030 [Leptospira borgpetersenii serovar Mini str. 201000851]|uniref:Uncharacterized protein n=3 Tax=Leptospira borgpetersenii TaxID=174 RepID=M3HVW5_LEPBO|nr:hypothetical protein LEP1GSC128_2938 [Leptospira borgpetersenii str. 200801926]EMG01730.1 hypothetical protein LEP1GSC123_4250 [Leptospira borgpetersenii str. 200701203]EMN14019.1 hypothetical protein LEP1GSC055_2600 [Leptospira borgpetersenii str. Brem 307]EMN18964.1 hypothetical protein LEP1GSC056_2074 [Leptospira borgpetersenii str. Brem 328]ENO63660.1 hypothetical protein LEP1GSC191_2030 [Leptospira borgpetersenii serovar Mini str. 201000851]